MGGGVLADTDLEFYADESGNTSANHLRDEYVPALRRGGWGAELRGAFQPDLGPLSTIFAGAFAVRDRLDAADLRVRTPRGTVRAPYFDRDIMSPARLRTLEASVMSQLASLV